MPKNTRWSKADLLKIGLLLLICGLYLVYLINNSYNVPFWDDWDSSLEFLNKFILAANWHEKARILFQQHNEHIIVFSKLVELFQYKLSGQLNFLYLVWLLNILLCLVIWVLLQNCSSELRIIDRALVIVPMLLNPIQFENQIWAGAGLQQYGQILCSLLIFSFLAAYLSKPSKWSGICCIFLLFANSLIGGGFIAAYLTFGLVLLAYKKYLPATLVMALFAINCYFVFAVIAYTFIPHGQAAWYKYPLAFLTFSGAISSEKYSAALIGGAIVSLLYYLRRSLLQNKFYLIWVVFYFLTGVLVAFSRSAMVANQANSRYAIYSLITCSIILLLLMNRPAVRQSTRRICLLLPVGYFLLMDYVVPQLDYVTPGESYLAWHHQAAVSGELNCPPEMRRRVIASYQQAKALGIYQNNQIDRNLADSANGHKP